MDWVTNGLKLLGLALLALWEYIVFQQRYRAKSDKLRARQVEGAVAILGVLNSFLTTLNTSHAASQGAAAEPPHRTQQRAALHAQAVATHRRWIAVLPNQVNDSILRFLALAQPVVSTPCPSSDETRRQLNRAYLDVIASVRQSLSIPPLGPELEEQLAKVA